METQKRARYSKSMESPEIVEILMEDESDEELEELNELIEGSQNASPSVSSPPHSPPSPSSDEEEIEIEFRHRTGTDTAGIHDFTGLPHGIKQSAVPNISPESSPFTIFFLFFRQIFVILLRETNRYFHQYVASLDEADITAQQPDITMEEMYRFFAVIIQMGHDQRDCLKDYWSREQQYFTPFYSNTMVRDRFFHILRFLHFENNDNPLNHDDPHYDRLWKIRNVSDTLNNKFYELYNPTEHLAVDEVIVLFKCRVIFRQYTPKKHKRFGIKIYKLCDAFGYTYDMSVYVGKQWLLATQEISATHGTVLELVKRVEGLGHKLYRVSQEKRAKLREGDPYVNYTDITQNTYIQS